MAKLQLIAPHPKEHGKKQSGRQDVLSGGASFRTPLALASEQTVDFAG